MKKTNTHLQGKRRLPSIALFGVLIFIVFQCMILGICTTLTMHQTIHNDNSEIILLAGTVVSALLSGLITLRKEENCQLKIVSVLAGLIVMIIVSLNMAFSGSIIYTWKSVLTVIAGLVTSCCIRPKSGKSKIRKKLHL